MKFTEAKLKLYAAPLGKTEDEKCKQTIELIRDALKDIGYSDNGCAIELLEEDTFSYALRMEKPNGAEKLHIFVQSSYANNTCVRAERDVDVAVVREDVFDYAFGSPFTAAHFEHRTEALTLKSGTELALLKKLPNQIRRGNTSLKVDGNTGREIADIVPGIFVKYFYRSGDDDYSHYLEGINLYADDGTVTTHFPLIQLVNGKNKNIQTESYYKRMVRIIKTMRSMMSDRGYSSADQVSSFGLESLLWNIPDEYFIKWYKYGYAFGEILEYLKENKESFASYYEANGIKKLCPTEDEAGVYGEFVEELARFFVYETE